MGRLQEIKTRKLEIRTLLESDSEVDLNALEAELRELATEEETIEKRQALVADIADVETRNIEPSFSLENETREKEEPTDETEMEQRGVDLAENRSVTVASGTLIIPTHDSARIRDPFNQISSLIDRVQHTPLDGGESYQVPYEIKHGTGNYTLEGEPYYEASVEFDYAVIAKSKITAYNEITEEVLKLPRANYARRVLGGVNRALRRKITREILIGEGGTNQMVGIFSEKAKAINPATDMYINAITVDTLDDIIYSFGGEEDVEDESVLILSKVDLRAFARVRDNDNRKYYDIVNNGNTGTINSVPFIINSACGSLQSEDGTYLMAYGPLSNYELGIFSPTDIQRSTDYKFREAMIAHRGSIFTGGNVVSFNGFVRVKKGTPVEATTEKSKK